MTIQDAIKSGKQIRCDLTPHKMWLQVRNGIAYVGKGAYTYTFSVAEILDNTWKVKD